MRDHSITVQPSGDTGHQTAKTPPEAGQLLDTKNKKRENNLTIVFSPTSPVLSSGIIVSANRFFCAEFLLLGRVAET